MTQLLHTAVRDLNRTTKAPIRNLNYTTKAPVRDLDLPLDAGRLPGAQFQRLVHPVAAQRGGPQPDRVAAPGDRHRGAAGRVRHRLRRRAAHVLQ